MSQKRTTMQIDWNLTPSNSGFEGHRDRRMGVNHWHTGYRRTHYTQVLLVLRHEHRWMNHETMGFLYDSEYNVPMVVVTPLRKRKWCDDLRVFGTDYGDTIPFVVSSVSFSVFSVFSVFWRFAGGGSGTEYSPKCWRYKPPERERNSFNGPEG